MTIEIGLFLFLLLTFLLIYKYYIDKHQHNIIEPIEETNHGARDHAMLVF